jgi:two-component system KDP operon response regulator KdpE
VCDGLEIDLAARTVRVDGAEVHLTPIEYSLLRAHVANLRRKIEPANSKPRYIRTDLGVGYRFAA